MERNRKSITTFAKLLCVFALAVFIFSVRGTSAKAAMPAPGKVTGVKQVDGRTDAVKVKWNYREDADGYTIAMSAKRSSGFEIVREDIGDDEGDDYDYDEDYDDSHGSCWISDYDYGELEAGKTYYVKVSAYREYEDEDGDVTRVTGAASAVLEVVTLPEAPSYLKHKKSTGNSISMSWGKSSGANTYKIIYNKVGDKKVHTKETTGTSITLKKLSKNSEYHICVQAGRKASNGYKLYGVHEWNIREWGPDEDEWEYDDDLHEYDTPEEMVPEDLEEFDAGNWRGWTNIPVIPQRITSIKTEFDSRNTGKLRVKTNARYSADGYEYELWSASGGKSKKIKSFTKKGYQNQKMISDRNFKKNNFYKLRVRAYCLNGKKQKQRSKWSDYVYISRQPEISKSYRQTSNGLKIKWNKIKGSSRYVVYVSTSAYGKYSKSAVTKKNTVNITKCYKKKLKHGRVYYFYVVAQKKAGNKYYNSGVSKYWYCGYR